MSSPTICSTEAPVAAESKKKSIGKALEKSKEEKQKKASVKSEGDKRGSKASAPPEEVSTLTIQYSSLEMILAWMLIGIIILSYSLLSNSRKFRLLGT